MTIHEPGRTPLHLVLRGTVDVGRECDGVLLADAELSRRHLRVSATADRGGGGRPREHQWHHGRRGAARRSHGVASRPGRALRSVSARRGARAPRHARLAHLRRLLTVDRVPGTAADADFAPWVRAEGTVAVVVSDIEQWTRRIDQLGDVRASSVLQLHHGLVRRSVERWGGAEIGAHDDAFMLVFPRAIVAAHFSVDVMRGSPRTPARSRGRGAPSHRRPLRRDRRRKPPRARGSAAPVGLDRQPGEGGEVLVSGLVREILETSDAVTFGAARHVRLADDGDPYALHPMTRSVRND